MPMYNLIKYGKNYSNVSGSLWNYYRDETRDDTNDNNSPNKNIIDSKSFKYKTSITGSTYNINERNADGSANPDYDVKKFGTKEVEITVPLKHLSNFWRALSTPLIFCEVNLVSIWFGNCVITTMTKREVIAAQGGNPVVYDNSPTGSVLAITDAKLYVPVVTLFAQDDNKL